MPRPRSRARTHPLLSSLKAITVAAWLGYAAWRGLECLTSGAGVRPAVMAVILAGVAALVLSSALSQLQRCGDRSLRRIQRAHPDAVVAGVRAEGWVGGLVIDSEGVALESASGLTESRWTHRQIRSCKVESSGRAGSPPSLVLRFSHGKPVRLTLLRRRRFGRAATSEEVVGLASVITSRKASSGV